MQSRNYSFLLALTGIVTITGLVSGCSKMLNQAPPDTINTANFYQTAADAIQAINGAYQPLQWPKLYNFRMWTTDIMAGNAVTGAGGGTDGIETIQESEFITQSDNAGVIDLWRGPWPGILACNIVLQKVPAISMDQALKNRILGEAKFLRANYYFILVRFFGDVPLITVPQVPGDNLQVSRTPQAQVYTQIIQDLLSADSLLPGRETYTGSDVGRASKGAAAAMLAKVYLTMGNYPLALQYCQQVDGLGYALDADYKDNFDPTSKNTVESVFEIQYSGAANSFSNDFFTNNFFQASWSSTYTGPRSVSWLPAAYGWDQPTREFVDSYEPGDLRKDETVLYNGCPQIFGNTYDSTYSQTGFNLRKFLVSPAVSPAYNTSPEDFPALRYADVLLMESEALNETGQTAAAEIPLNKVRTRAGLGPITSGLSQSDFRNAVLHERRMELAFEGQRWFDLVRQYNNGNKQYALDFFNAIGKTNFTANPAKFVLLPIPLADIQANPNLKQNPGY